MQGKVEAYRCNLCFKKNGTVLLDCFCLFCNECFEKSGIRQPYEEKAKMYQKGQPQEKCQRCKRNTEYKIFYLENKAQSMPVQSLFGNVNACFMSFMRIVDFQILQKNRENAYLLSLVRKYEQLQSRPPVQESVPGANLRPTEIIQVGTSPKIVSIPVITVEKITMPNTPTNYKEGKSSKQLKEVVLVPVRESEVQRGLTSIQEFPDEEAMKTPDNKTNKFRSIHHLKPPPSNVPSDVSREPKTIAAMDPQQLKSIKPFQQMQRPSSAFIPSHIQGSGFVHNTQFKSLNHREMKPELPRVTLEEREKVKNKLEFETPIAPQLKKSKLTENSIDKDQLKKIFGFEVHEIKKSGSNRRSTERPVLSDDKNFQLGAAPTTKKSHADYFGRGYNLNYPNYQG